MYRAILACIEFHFPRVELWASGFGVGLVEPYEVMPLSKDPYLFIYLQTYMMTHAFTCDEN